MRNLCRTNGYAFLGTSGENTQARYTCPKCALNLARNTSKTSKTSSVPYPPYPDATWIHEPKGVLLVLLARNGGMPQHSGREDRPPYDGNVLCWSQSATA